MFKQAVKEASPTGKLTDIGFKKVSGKWKADALEQNELIEARNEAMKKGKSLQAIAYKGEQAQAAAPAQDDWSSLGKPSS